MRFVSPNTLNILKFYGLIAVMIFAFVFGFTAHQTGSIIGSAVQSGAESLASVFSNRIASPEIIFPKAAKEKEQLFPDFSFLKKIPVLAAIPYPVSAGYKKTFSKPKLAFSRLWASFNYALNDYPDSVKDLIKDARTEANRFLNWADDSINSAVQNLISE